MRQIYGNFHYPKKMSEIMLGNREQYVTTKQLIDEFKKFIINTWDELAKYSKEELASVGITTPEIYSSQCRQGIFKLNISDSELHISLWNYGNNNDLQVNAYQSRKLDTAVGRITFDSIVASICVLNFVANHFQNISKTQESHFSFGNEGTDIKGNPIGTYVEGFSPQSTEVITFDEKNGCYRVIDKSAIPKKIYIPGDTTYYDGDYNKNATYYADEPFICTTYSSYEEANEDMQNKITAFENEWYNALNELKAKYKKTSGEKPKAHTRSKLPPALAMAIFKK